MQYLADFAGQNWLITPAALAVGENPPTHIRDQKWLLVLSGVVIANFKGDNSGNWNQQTVSFIPDMAGTDDPSSTSGPLNWAISQYSIPKPPVLLGRNFSSASRWKSGRRSCHSGQSLIRVRLSTPALL